MWGIHVKPRRTMIVHKASDICKEKSGHNCRKRVHENYIYLMCSMRKTVLIVCGQNLEVELEFVSSFTNHISSIFCFYSIAPLFTNHGSCNKNVPIHIQDQINTRQQGLQQGNIHHPTTRKPHLFLDWVMYSITPSHKKKKICFSLPHPDVKRSWKYTYISLIKEHYLFE